MSEDRNKHDRAGNGEGTLGHRVGRSRDARKAEARAGMGQHIPDAVRAEVDGTKAKTTKGKSR